MFLPNSNSFSLVRSKISKPVIQPGDFDIEESANRNMFLPNSYSFSLVRLNSGRKVFLSNSHSFLLTRSVISKPAIQSGIFAVEESATNLPRFSGIADPELRSVPLSPSPDSGQTFAKASAWQGKSTIGDKNKRTFLKMAGIAGASIIGSLFLPKEADALIMGSSPTTGVVGVKNAANTRINPAREETVATLATQATVSTLLKPTDLDFDASGYLNVNVASPITSATETTLETIAFGGKQYALKMTTVGSVDYIGEATVGTAFATALWRAKKVDSTTGIVITWADGNENFDNSATDLTTLTYS